MAELGAVTAALQGMDERERRRVQLSLGELRLASTRVVSPATPGSVLGRQRQVSTRLWQLWQEHGSPPGTPTLERP